ncbi:hypothetical protein EUX98_g2303 [Antrodiella citrinella]|uniref:Kinase n=1 Tax=Antrodiella citrinella TaxID=2447956 RepID=A0A4S4N230_9APHY|nr:hypothetical protein EUX98_g2303 [Antrodiella citrinella]
MSDADADATPRSSPPLRGHASLASQVGGHGGVMTSEDGSLLIKPALPVEISFYQSVGSDPGFAPLRPFIPKFYGTLKLEGQLEVGGSTESIVLENLTQSFSKPSILDLKLGTVLYDEEATPEKKARMEKTARDTTSFETGIRITGFQIHDLAAGVPINTSREYGKTLKKDDLPSAFARFFPASTLPAPPQASTSAPSADEEEDVSVESQLIPSDGTGLPAHTLLPILRGILHNVEEIRDAVAQVEMRMVGGSLLVIYEADWERAAEGIRLEAEGEFLDDEDDDSDEDEDEDDDDETEKKIGRAYCVKIIDFAHTYVLPGRGPDQSLLTGMDTTIRLLKGRIVEVEATVKTAS